MVRAILRFLGVGGDGPPSVRRPHAPAPAGGLLGQGLVMKGEVSGEGDLRVAGRFEGEIALTGTVYVEEGAELDANVSAAAIVIGGVVRGNLSATTRVEILPTGTLTGTLRSGSFTAAPGATVKGEVWVERPAPALESSASAPTLG
jgi:cytoskeletal protein CcmA (bactofilin family)